MKTIKIYTRKILERTGYKAHPYKDKRQFIVTCGGKIYRNGHLEDLSNPRLKIPFAQVIETRSKKALEALIKTLGRTDDEKWLKATLDTLTKETEDK